MLLLSGTLYKQIDLTKTVQSSLSSQELGILLAVEISPTLPMLEQKEAVRHKSVSIRPNLSSFIESAPSVKLMNHDLS